VIIAAGERSKRRVLVQVPRAGPDSQDAQGRRDLLATRGATRRGARSRERDDGDRRE